MIMPEVTHKSNNIEEDEDKAYNQYVNSTDIPDDQIIESIFSERKLPMLKMPSIMKI